MTSPAGVVATTALEGVVVVLRLADLLAVALAATRLLRRTAEEHVGDGVSLLLGLATLGHGGSPFGR